MPSDPSQYIEGYQFSDEIQDITYETSVATQAEGLITYEKSVATQAEGLITGICRIRCVLRDGVAITDIPYEESIIAEDGTLYTVLISVEGRLLKCLKYDKNDVWNAEIPSAA